MAAIEPIAYEEKPQTTDHSGVCQAKIREGCPNAQMEMRTNLNSGLRKGRKCPHEQVSSLPLSGNGINEPFLKVRWHI